MAIRSKTDQFEDQEDSGVVLLIQVPRGVPHDAAVAEQLLASLHSLLTLPISKLLRKVKRERISLEIALTNKRIGFYVWVPEYLESYVIEQIHAKYPTATITKTTDYMQQGNAVYASTLIAELEHAEEANTDTDSVTNFTTALANLDHDEQAWLQLLARPARSSIKAVVADNQEPFFELQGRVVYQTNEPLPQARLRMQSLVGSHDKFVISGQISTDPQILSHVRSRRITEKTKAQTSATVTKLFYFPHAAMQNPYIVWASLAGSEPPHNLPVQGDVSDHISLVGSAKFGEQTVMFGLPRPDRARHTFIAGQPGVGKTSLLELLTISDIYSPYGFAVIDPSGEYAKAILARIPHERAADVIYVNPADLEYPVAFNPLEVADKKLRARTAEEISLVIKPFCKEWDEVTEKLLYHSLEALIDYPDGTLLDIPRLLRDKVFREEVLEHSAHAASFWRDQFGHGGFTADSPAAMSLTAIAAALASDPVLRSMLGQSKTGFDVRRSMDSGKIILIDLGNVAKQNATLLASLFFVNIQVAALSRNNIPAEHRLPFYLYVDDFQAVIASNMPTVLREARQYGLNLTLASQHMPHLEAKDIQSFGTLVTFRLGEADAALALEYFGSQVFAYDLMYVANRQYMIGMTVAGEKLAPFGALSLTLSPHDQSYGQAIIGHSRSLYSSSKAYVDNYLTHRYADTSKVIKPSKTAPKKQVPPKTAQHAEVIDVTPSTAQPAKDPSIPKKTEPPKVQIKKRKTLKKRKKNSGVEAAIAQDMQLLENEDANGL